MSHRLPLGDIQFLADFHAYCLTRGDEGYDSMNPYKCALAQFGHVVGCEEGCAGRDIPVAAFKAAVHGTPETFSALATRLEALLADAPAVSVAS